MSEPLDDPVGSAAEEAAKLVGALADWAREHGAHLGDGLGAVAHDLDDHLVTDGAECQWCPVCRTVRAVRSASPEVREHLATAVTSLAQAATAFLTTPPPGRTEPGVERIDVSDDWPEEDDG